MRYRVTGRGIIDAATLDSIDLEFTPGGGTVGAGDDLPTQPKRFHFWLDASSEDQAIEIVSRAVADTDGLLGSYNAEPARSAASP